MSSFRKHSGEKLVRPLDWTPRLKSGDAPTGTPTISVTPAGMTAVYDSTQGNLTWLKIESGTAGTIHTIAVTTTTAAGETLIAEIAVTVF